MICPNCAAVISDSAKVCGYCGTRLQRIGSVSEPAVALETLPEAGEPEAQREVPATKGDDPAIASSTGSLEKPEQRVANASQPGSAPVQQMEPPAAPATVASEAEQTPPAPPKGSLRWFAAAGLVVLAVLAADLLGCSFGLHEYVSGDGICERDVASFWTFNFIPALLFLAMMWLGSRARRKAQLGWQTLFAAAGIALSVWAVIFNDATYWCAGQVAGGPYPQSDRTFCAIEWGREGAYVIVGLLFLAALIGAVTDRRYRRRFK